MKLTRLFSLFLAWCSCTCQCMSLRRLLFPILQNTSLGDCTHSSVKCTCRSSRLVSCFPMLCNVGRRSDFCKFYVVKIVKNFLIIFGTENFHKLLSYVTLRWKVTCKAIVKAVPFTKDGAVVAIATQVFCVLVCLCVLMLLCIYVFESFITH